MPRVLNHLWARRRAIVFYALVLGVGWAVGKLIDANLAPAPHDSPEPLMQGIMLSALILYVLLAALPFVPGAEIGLAMLLAAGAPAVPIVYAGMVCALVLSYGVGRLVPLTTVARAAHWLGLSRLSELATEFSVTPFAGQAALLEGKVASRLGRAFLRNRYVLLAVLLNLPGNSVIGGGGGIALAAGLSGLYRFGPFLLSVLIAVSPVPLLVLLSGG